MPYLDGGHVPGNLSEEKIRALEEAGTTERRDDVSGSLSESASSIWQADADPARPGIIQPSDLL
jgi:hypothetical protein